MFRRKFDYETNWRFNWKTIILHLLYLNSIQFGTGVLPVHQFEAVHNPIRNLNDQPIHSYYEHDRNYRIPDSGDNNNDKVKDPDELLNSHLDDTYETFNPFSFESSIEDQNNLSKFEHSCEPITMNLCKGMYYEYARMPNIFQHQTQEEAGLEAHQFYPLVQINCSKDLRFLLCSLYTPICVKGYPHFLPPCRSICERVKAGCDPIMKHYQFSWPERMNCEQFPNHNNPEGVLCMERNITQEENHKFLNVNHGKNDINEVQLLQKNTTAHQIIKINNSNSKYNIEDNYFNIDSDYHMVDYNKTINSYFMDEISVYYPNIKKFKQTYPDFKLNCKCKCNNQLVNKSLTSDFNNQITFGEITNCVVPCKSSYFLQNVTVKFLAFWICVWSIACLVSTLLTLCTYLIQKQNLLYPERSVIYLSICYLFISITYLVRVFAGYEIFTCDRVPSTDLLESGAKVNLNGTNSMVSIKQLNKSTKFEAGCLLTFTLNYYFGMSALCWWIVLSWTWFLSAALKWSNEAIVKYSQLFHFICWTLPGFQCLFVLFIGPIEGNMESERCTISTKYPFAQILLILIPKVMYLTTGVILFLIGSGSLIRTRNKIHCTYPIPTDERVEKLQQPQISCTGMGTTYPLPEHFLFPLKSKQNLNKLIFRMNLFAFLYILIHLFDLMFLVHEMYYAKLWQFNVACRCVSMDRTVAQTEEYQNMMRFLNSLKPNYELYLLKYFLQLIIAFLAGILLIWSRKTFLIFCNVFYKPMLKRTTNYPNGPDIKINNKTALGLNLNHEIDHSNTSSNSRSGLLNMNQFVDPDCNPFFKQPIGQIPNLSDLINKSSSKLNEKPALTQSTLLFPSTDPYQVVNSSYYCSTNPYKITNLTTMNQHGEFKGNSSYSNQNLVSDYSPYDHYCSTGSVRNQTYLESHRNDSQKTRNNRNSSRHLAGSDNARNLRFI